MPASYGKVAGVVHVAMIADNGIADDATRGTGQVKTAVNEVTSYVIFANGEGGKLAILYSYKRETGFFSTTNFKKIADTLVACATQVCVRHHWITACGRAVTVKFDAHNDRIILLTTMV